MIDLATYRDRLEQMTAEALEEYYSPSAGLKPTMEMARVYERYADMTALDAARELAEMGAPLELQRFAAEAYVGDGSKQLTVADASTLQVVRTYSFSAGVRPFVITPDEWTALEAGLVQRAWLLDALLADLYGPQSLLAERLVPPMPLNPPPA